MIVGKPGIAVLPGFASISTGTVIFAKPPNPMFFLGQIPNMIPFQWLICGKSMDRFDKLVNTDFFFHNNI